MTAPTARPPLASSSCVSREDLAGASVPVLFSPTEIIGKLRMIAALTADELPAYRETARQRGFFDGEHAALIKREMSIKGGDA